MRSPVALFALALVSACAPTGQVGPSDSGSSADQTRQCFYQSQITNFRQGGTQSVFIKVMNRDVYEVTSGGCTDVDFASALSITPDFGDSGRLCVGDSVRLAARGAGTIAQPCRGRVTRQLTEADIEALPPRQRP